MITYMIICMIIYMITYMMRTHERACVRAGGLACVCVRERAQIQIPVASICIQIPVASMGASIYARVLRHAQVHTCARHAHATVYATQHTQRDTRVGIRDEEVGIRDEELGIGD